MKSGAAQTKRLKVGTNIRTALYGLNLSWFLRRVLTPSATEMPLTCRRCIFASSTAAGCAQRMRSTRGAPLTADASGMEHLFGQRLTNAQAPTMHRKANTELNADLATMIDA